jgi:polyisoprenoid-binding protein YceI
MRLAVLSLLGAFAFPTAVRAVQVSFKNGSISSGTLSFDAHATAGDFTGSTDSVSGQASGASLGETRGWVEAPVRTLKTGNNRRDRDLNKSMESDRYPTIRFDLHDVALGAAGGDSSAVMLNGRLTIHGVTRDVALPATIFVRPDTVHLVSSFPLNLKDYQIGGLSKMLGMLKMYPDIVVHVNLNFEEGR